MTNEQLIDKYLETFDGSAAAAANRKNELRRALAKVNKPVEDMTESDRSIVIEALAEANHEKYGLDFFSWFDDRKAQLPKEDLKISHPSGPKLKVFEVPSTSIHLLDDIACPLEVEFVRVHDLTARAQDRVRYCYSANITGDNTTDTRSETEHQISVMNWTRRLDVRAQYPELEYIYHTANEIPNSDKMAPEDLEQIRRERYQMGVQAGIPDLCLPVAKGRYHALYIEMKSLKQSAAPSEKQLEKLGGLRECGNAAEICYGDVDAINLIINYLELGNGESL